MEDGRPGAFNLIGVIFPALCVMVLSTNVFVCSAIFWSVIFYAGVYTLRINDMPLSGLRIQAFADCVGLIRLAVFCHCRFYSHAAHQSGGHTRAYHAASL